MATVKKEPITVKKEALDTVELINEKILELCSEFSEGINDKVLQYQLPDVDPKLRAKSINSLLNAGKIDLFKNAKGLVYKAKSDSASGSIKGDQEEKIVYAIIEESGNKGTWIRDIRLKCNLVQTQLTKVLKALESKKLIKSVKSVNATKKKVYMKYDLEPDISVTGGAWYSDQDFESEFVEILNQQCCKFLQQKRDMARKSKAGPLAARNLSMAALKEVHKFISDLGISKVQLKMEDIENILDTLIFDGKVEKTTKGDDAKFYRAIEPLVPTTGIVRIPCGICPVSRNCSDIGAITPTKCTYLRDWLS